MRLPELVISLAKATQQLVAAGATQYCQAVRKQAAVLARKQTWFAR